MEMILALTVTPQPKRTIRKTMCPNFVGHWDFFLIVSDCLHTRREMTILTVNLEAGLPTCLSVIDTEDPIRALLLLVFLCLFSERAKHLPQKANL